MEDIKIIRNIRVFLLLLLLLSCRNGTIKNSVYLEDKELATNNNLDVNSVNYYKNRASEDFIILNNMGGIRNTINLGYCICNKGKEYGDVQIDTIPVEYCTPSVIKIKSSGDTVTVFLHMKYKGNLAYGLNHSGLYSAKCVQYKNKKIIGKCIGEYCCYQYEKEYSKQYISKKKELLNKYKFPLPKGASPWFKQFLKE